MREFSSVYLKQKRQSYDAYNTASNYPIRSKSSDACSTLRLISSDAFLATHVNARKFWPRTLTHVNLNHVNKIEARYENFTHARTHVKITRQWKSTR